MRPLITLRINLSPKRLELQSCAWSHLKEDLKSFPMVTYFYIFGRTGLSDEGSKAMQIINKQFFFLFRCVLASLYEALSVRWSVRPSVGPSVRPSVGNAFVKSDKNEYFSP